jgi:tetratricopeptide (TPR) repeat protein
MASINETLQLALEHHRQGRLAEAEGLYRQVLQADPRNADALHLMGVLATRVGKYELAVNFISHAIRLQGKHPAFHVNLSDALQRWDRNADALAAARQAVRLEPTYAEGHNSVGSVLKSLGRLDEALAAFTCAIDIKGDYVDAHYNRALLRISLGDFSRGWDEYEWRWKRPNFHQPALPKPRWDGSPLAGRMLLVQCEQGFGDTIQFIRYVKQMQAGGERVMVVPQLPLVPLLVTSGVQNVIPPGTPLSEFDVYLPLLSLPRVIGTTLETIPADVPYLAADAALVEQWKTRLAAMGGFKIGIHWQGNPQSPLEPRRSIPLAEFAPLALEGVSLIGLQKGFGIEQIPAAKSQLQLVDLGGELDEAHGAFMDTAAIMRNLDLVITSDTVTAHLAGALGVPVWLPLSCDPDWRWMHERCDCPWYPTMRLFRQPEPGNWSAVFAEMAGELKKLVGE